MTDKDYLEIKVWLSCGRGMREDVIIVPVNFSDDDIELEVRDWADNYIEWGWEKLND